MNFDRDPVVDEVRKVREMILKEFDYDPHKLGKFLADRENPFQPMRKQKNVPRKRALAAIH